MRVDEIFDLYAENKNKIILDLCGGTGSWSKPYKVAGYNVILVTLPDNDVRHYHPPPFVYGILAAPPCTHFAISGARWWKEKDKNPDLLKDALDIVDACLNIITMCKPKFWALENPIGRLRKLRKDALGNPKLIFNPCDYGDPWTKKTLLWGKFKLPIKNPVQPQGVLVSSGKNRKYKELSSRIHRLPLSKDRTILRSITPPHFAQAFFEANM